MTLDLAWGDPLERDVRFGYLAGDTHAPRQHHPQVVLNENGGSVLRTLRDELRRCSSFTFSVAFVSPRAIALLKQELVDFAGAGRIITSDYLAFNSPQAFAELYNLRNLGIDVRVHQSKAFHPKGYIFEHGAGITAMVGSANLTENALAKNHEWNLKVYAAVDSDLETQIRELVHRELSSSVELTPEWIDNYAARYVAPRPPALQPAPSSTIPTPAVRILPNQMQRVALGEIAQSRMDGNRRAIVISATGTGKTILSALDVRSVAPKRFLFVVHREQILDRTIEEYQRVLVQPASAFGKLTGSSKQPDRQYLFATVQTLSRPDVLATFAADEFDYIIIDEAHRAGAPSYQRVLEHFDPQFLLGMTATPERGDGFNVFELFDYNVPYEIRLNHALEEDMLSPFHYYGVAEVVYEDGTTVTDESELSVLISSRRVQHLISAIETYGQAGVSPCGLIFCSRKAEAYALSTELNQRSLRGKPLRTVALTGDDSIEHRELMVDRLERGELDYILTVDVFNEGVDIPPVNQVIMLRQTQSAIVFVQQLGRGLRKARDKEYLVVIDFIGNYANNFLIPIALFGD